MPSIKNDVIQTIFGKPLKIPERNDDGDVVWEDETNSKAKTQDAQPVSVIREVLLSINGIDVLRRIQKPMDSMRAHRTWNQLEKEREGDLLHLKQDEYEWLHSLLERKVAVTREAKEAGAEDRTVVSHLYGINEWMVTNALKSLDQRVEPETETEA